jgi:hypothetical protein
MKFGTMQSVLKCDIGEVFHRAAALGYHSVELDWNSPADALPGGDSAPLALLPEARPFRTASGTGFRTESAPADGELSARLKPLLAADRNNEAERLWLAAGAEPPVAVWQSGGIGRCWQ